MGLHPNLDLFFMTQDEIIEMLRASCDKDRVDPEQNGFWVIVTEELEAFAKLVAQHEREEIAQFIERTNLGSLPDETALHYAQLLKSYSTAIRARGQG